LYLIAAAVDEKTHRESLAEIKYWHDFMTKIFIILIKLLFAVNLKHSSFLPSADVKPLSNDLVHAMHRYLRKVDCSSFVMCLLLALAFPRNFCGSH
jgi:hypothetical protein